MWGWLSAIVRGIVEPLIASWQQYQHGRAAQQRDDLQATVEVERAMEQAVQTDRASRVDMDADVLRERIAQARAERDRRAKGHGQ